MQADELDTHTHTHTPAPSQIRQQYLRFYFFWLLSCDATSIQGDFQIHFCSFAAICVHWLNVHSVYLHHCHVFLNTLPMGTPKKLKWKPIQDVHKTVMESTGCENGFFSLTVAPQKTTALTQTSIKEYMEISAQVRCTPVCVQQHRSQENTANASVPPPPPARRTPKCLNVALLWEKAAFSPFAQASAE